VVVTVTGLPAEHTLTACALAPTKSRPFARLQPLHSAKAHPCGYLAVPELGDVHMSQLIQGQVTKLGHKQRLSLLRQGLELAAVRGRVLPHVNAIRIRKHGLGQPLLPPEVPRNQLRQKILVKINAVEADFPPGKDQQFIWRG
jgi:hypothetical protein